MLIGILGDKALSDYGYPDPHTSGSIHILHRILDKARVEVILKVKVNSKMINFAYVAV